MPLYGQERVSIGLTCRIQQWLMLCIFPVIMGHTLQKEGQRKQHTHTLGLKPKPNMIFKQSASSLVCHHFFVQIV